MKLLLQDSFLNKYNGKIYDFVDNRYKIFKWSFLFLLFSFFIVLSFYSFPIADASLYFHETVHIADTLKNGAWIGNEPVGTHGFLFKIIPAILFIFLGINPLYLTLFHVVLSFLSVLIFEKILSLFITEKVYLFSGIMLFSTTYIFIHGSLTYYREIPVLFSTMLLIYALTNKKKSWVIGLALLLIFDAKEHVFFQIAPGLFLFTIHQMLFVKRSVKLFLQTNLFYWLPVFLYLLAMLFTGIIPLNGFVLAILPISQRGTAWVKSGFTNGYMTTNERNLYSVTGESPIFIQNFMLFREYLSNTYFAKPFLPRVFSFLSVHFIFVIPSFYYVLHSLKNLISGKKNLSIGHLVDERLIELLFIYISFILVYFFRVSHGRYLFSLSPLIFLFFFLYIKDISDPPKKMFIFLIIYSVLALVFELNFISVKIIMALVILSLIYFIFFVDKKYILLLSLILMIFTGGSSVLGQATLNDGFIRRHFLHGRTEEADLIFHEGNLGGGIYTNFSNIGTAKSFSHAKIPSYFLSNRFELIDLFSRKREMLNTYYDSPNVFSFGTDQSHFVEDFKSYNIDTMFFFKSTTNRSKYGNEDFLEELIKDNPSIFILEEVRGLTNKNVYIYKIRIE